MNLTVITPPPSDALVVTLQEVYDHLRLVPSDESPTTHPQDAMLTRLIKVATGEAEKITHRALLEQTIRLVTTGFPSRTFVPYWATYPWGSEYVWHRYGIELLRPPFLGVQAVRYYDADNVLQTMEADQFFVTDDLVPTLRFVEGFSAPTLYGRSDAVQIDYVAGYPPEGSPAEDYAANIPDEIKQAVLLGVEIQYRSLDVKNRQTLENARDALLAGFMVYTIV